MASLIVLYFLYSFTIFFFCNGNTFTHSIEIFSIVLSFIEISSKFFLGIYNKGEIVTDRLFIFKTYIKSTFFFDLISLLSVIASALKFTDSYQINSAIQSIFLLEFFQVEILLRRSII